MDGRRLQTARARHSVRGRVQALLGRAGWEIRPLKDDADARRMRLIEAERIDLVLDVGANVGQFAMRLRSNGYAGRIVSFEPYGAAFGQLQRTAAKDPAWKARNLALAEEEGEAELNVSANSFSSSLLPMRERHVEIAPDSAYAGTERVRTARLDALWEDVVGSAANPWLKLDVQGFELSVLRGAGERLDAARVVQAELSLTSLYEGDAPWRELVDWLEQRGFALAGVEPGEADPASGRLLQFDGTFVRS